MASGATFADTVRAMRTKSGVNVGELGAPIKTMRRTRDGNLLLEFGGGAKAKAAAAKLKSLLVSSISEDVGQIVNLGSLIDIEIVDIDAIASREEVEEALNKVVGAKLGAAKDKVLEDIKLTGLWSTRSGQQIVMARVSRSVVNSLDIGFRWDGRCVGFDLVPHNRCGATGAMASATPRATVKAPTSRWPVEDVAWQVLEKDLGASGDICVACEREGFPRVPHRPGSGACAVRRAADQTPKLVRND